MELLERNGKLTLGELVRCRVRYFTDGLAVGSERFVEGGFEANRAEQGQELREVRRLLTGHGLPTCPF